MINCRLILTDWFTKKQTVKAIMPKDPVVASRIHSKNNPDCLVKIEWDNKSHTEQPYNMKLDQDLVSEGDMSVNRFTSKWYGKISKTKLLEIESEMAQEFVEESIDN